MLVRASPVVWARSGAPPASNDTVDISETPGPAPRVESTSMVWEEIEQCIEVPMSSVFGIPVPKRLSL